MGASRRSLRNADITTTLLRGRLSLDRINAGSVSQWVTLAAQHVAPSVTLNRREHFVYCFALFDSLFRPYTPSPRFASSQLDFNDFCCALSPQLCRSTSNQCATCSSIILHSNHCRQSNNNSIDCSLLARPTHSIRILP